MSIEDKVRNGEINLCCFDCADKHRTGEPYDGTITTRQGTCQICENTKTVASASKLFCFHRFV